MVDNMQSRWHGGYR